MSLIRLCYASRATFSPYTIDGIDHHVAEILAQSRRNNQRRNLVGALYYANGIFFQCLEGEESDIAALLETLRGDSRHKDLKILGQTSIQTRAFQDWEMKYAMLDREIRQFLHQHQFGKFDPYRFSAGMTAELIDVLLAAQDIANEQLLAVAHQPLPTSQRRFHPVFLTVVWGLLAASVATFLVDLWR